MDNLTLKIENTNGELTIREGKAVDPLPLREPKIISLSGDIHTISNFINIRKDNANGAQSLDAKSILITVDKVARTINMQLDPENFYGATISAKLEPSEELKPFHINCEKKFDRTQLLHLIKFSRLYFDDKQQHSNLLSSLSRLRIKTESELKQENDNRGNRTNSSERKVIDDSGFVQYFNLFIPIFKGFDPIKIQVEICYEPSESGIYFWLESPELAETTQSQIDKIFSDELKACEGYVIIYK